MTVGMPICWATGVQMSTSCCGVVELREGADSHHVPRLCGIFDRLDIAARQVVLFPYADVTRGQEEEPAGGVRGLVEEHKTILFRDNAATGSQGVERCRPG